MSLIDANKLHPGNMMLSAITAETVPAIPIPKRATNGDIMKLVFPNYKFSIHGDWVDIELKGKKFSFCPAEFWNAPYQLSLKEEIKGHQAEDVSEER